jgi:hypothetical protein
MMEQGRDNRVDDQKISVIGFKNLLESGAIKQKYLVARPASET